MKRLIGAVCCLFAVSGTMAQEKFTINGTVRDAANGEALIGATVYFKEIKSGATTNEYGFYSITVAPGKYAVKYSYIGYQLVSQTLDLDKNIQLNIELVPDIQQLEEVVVQAELEQANVQNIEMGTNKLVCYDRSGEPDLDGPPQR